MRTCIYAIETDPCFLNACYDRKDNRGNILGLIKAALKEFVSFAWCDTRLIKLFFHSRPHL